MMMRHFGMPMFGGMKVQNPMQNQGGPIQEPPMATFPGTADPAPQPAPQEQVRSPFNRGPVMGGGFMGGFGGGFGNWGGGFSRPLFPQFGGGFMGGFNPFGGNGFNQFSPSRQMMGGYMGNLMQPFSFGFQPPRTQQAPQPQMPGPNIPPPMTPDMHSLFGNN